MNMKVQLLVSQWCPSCPQAERVWEQVATAHEDIDYAVLDVAVRPGRDIVANLMIRSIPATVIDGKLYGVGVPSVADADAYLAKARNTREGVAG
ncbi:thioredoxin family protein [Acidihalobacter prosperus]|uniref:Thioredoxin-like fold domain-containing protein n=1 Tax=Acidihalobacter prosperus TaxID=160660 RepID=A0A1A6C8I0_9GAMM|nr:thioredoxin family protein [Acidihalobacter prosperus]OBS10855.1 hypothetical protein Thpro_020571 [Acidihalobacter prosperus]